MQKYIFSIKHKTLMVSKIIHRRNITRAICIINFRVG